MAPEIAGVKHGGETVHDFLCNIGAAWFSEAHFGPHVAPYVVAVVGLRGAYPRVTVCLHTNWKFSKSPPQGNLHFSLYCILQMTEEYLGTALDNLNFLLAQHEVFKGREISLQETIDNVDRIEQLLDKQIQRASQN